jgi:hypothetical protein
VLRESDEFVRLVREYNNGELYGRLIQIFDQDYEEQRFFLLFLLPTSQELNYIFLCIFPIYVLFADGGNTLCSSDFTDMVIVSRLEQLVENHSELREALKRLQVQVKVDNYILRIKVGNTISNKMDPINIMFTSLASHL